MLLPETIAQIILESIRLARVIIEGVPVAERQRLWEEHEARLAALRAFLDKLSAGLAPPTPPADGSPR